jgi:hypothetical protein
MKAHGREALVGGEWTALRPGRFTPGERASGTHWIGGWVGPRAVLDDVKNREFLTLPGLKLPPLGRPARSQSLSGLFIRFAVGNGKTKFRGPCLKRLTKFITSVN